MADIQYRYVVDDSQIQESRDRQIAMADELIDKEEELSKAMKGTYDDATESGKKYGKALDDLERKSDAAISKNREQVAAQIKDHKVLGISINDISGKVEKWKTTQRALTGAVGGGTKALKAFRIAMISTGIGALVVAAGALVAVLLKTQKGLDFISKGMAAVGEIGATVVDTLSSLGSALVNMYQVAGNILTLNFKGAVRNFNEAKEDIKAAGDELAGAGEDVQKAWSLEKQSQDLRDAAIQLRRDAAETRAEIKRLNKDAEDTTLPLEKRAAAAKKAYELENALVEQRLKLANEEVRILEEQQALGKNLTADNEQLTELIEKRAGIQQESLELQTTLQNKLNTIEAERQRKIDEYIKSLQEMKQRIQEINDEVLKEVDEEKLRKADPVTRLEAQRDAALKGLEEQRKELVKLAEKTGVDVTESLALIDLREDQIQAQFKEVIEKALIESRKVQVGEIEVDYTPLFDPDVGILSDTAETVVKKYIDAVTGEITDQIEVIDNPPELTIDIAPVPEGIEETKKGFFDFVNDFEGLLGEAFGKAADFVQSERFQTLFQDFNALAEGLKGIYQTQLDNIEELSAQREAQIDELIDQIDRQEELEEEGSANSIQRKKDELAALEAEQEAANERANQLRKRQAAIELAQNIAANVSSTTVAIAEVFKAHAGIPFVGVAIAAGFVATMLASIAASVQQAKQITALHTGAESLSDYLPGYSSDAVSGREDHGLRVVSRYGQDTGVRLGGREMIVRERTANRIGHVIQDLEKNPSKADQLLSWYHGLEGDQIITEKAYAVRDFISAPSLTAEQYERVMRKVMNEMYEKRRNDDDQIEHRDFVPDQDGTEYIRKGRKVIKRRVKKQRRRL